MFNALFAEYWFDESLKSGLAAEKLWRMAVVESSIDDSKALILGAAECDATAAAAWEAYVQASDKSGTH